MMDSRIYDDEGPPTPHQGHDGAFYEDPAGSGGNGSGRGAFSDGERVAPLGVPDYAPEWAPAELERYLHVVAMEKHTAHSVGRRDVLEKLHAHVDGVGNPNTLLLTGPAGSGKSTTLATLVSEMQSKTGGRVGVTPSALEAIPSTSGANGPESGPDPFVLLHTFGLMGRSDDIRRVLLRLCAELKQRFNIYVDLPNTLQEVAGALPRFLAHAALFGKVIFILDGLDRADMRGFELHDYLPAALPLAVRVIVSSAGCKPLNDARDTLSNLANVVQLPPLAHEERIGVLNSALATVAGGQMHVTEMLDGLVSKEDAGSPLYLLTAVNEIKARVRDNGDVYAAADDANGFPATLPELFSAVFERLERRYGTTLAAESTTLMAASRAGLREDEVLWLLQQTASLQNMPPSEWESLRTELEPYCWPVDRIPGDPTLCFFQGQFAAAAMRRYANTAAERRGQHLRLCSMFSDPSLEPTHRGVWEVLWNMLKGEAWHGLRCHLTDPRVHALLWNEDTQVDLANLWEALVKGEVSTANVRATKRVPGLDGAMVPPPRVPPRRRRDLVAEYDSLAETAPPSPDGVLTPDVYRELMADFLAWSNQPGEASFVLRMLSEAKGDAADLAAVSVNFKLGRCLGRQGLHLEAEETLRRALAAEQLLVGAETPMVAEIVTEICKVKLDEGDLEMAGQLAAHAVSVWEAAEAAGYEEADVNTIVTALVRLAEICDELNRTTAAEAAYERSLERLEYMLGPDHPEVAEHLGMMANSYKNHAEFEKAEFCYCRALAFAHRFTGPQSLHISHFYNALAELHRAQGDLPHAQALYQRALQVIETVLGTLHSEVATYLNNLAELLRVQGKLLEAEPMYKRALAIDERAQGTSHPIIAIRLNNLAELFRDRGLLEEAEPLYQRALAIDMAALGANHPNIATYLNNLAGLYKSRELWDKAAEHYTRAIAIDERALGPNHPDVAIYLNNLAGLYKAQGRLDEAEPLYLRALRINEEALGAEHTDMAIYFNNIALLYKAQGKLQDARLYYEQAIDIGERTLGAEHPQVATRMANLGALLVDMNELDPAQALFEKALEVRRNTVGENHPDTVNCAEWLESIREIRAELAEERAVEAARSAAAAVTAASAAPAEPPRLVGDVTPPPASRPGSGSGSGSFVSGGEFTVSGAVASSPPSCGTPVPDATVSGVRHRGVPVRHHHGTGADAPGTARVVAPGVPGETVPVPSVGVWTPSGVIRGDGGRSPDGDGRGRGGAGVGGCHAHAVREVTREFLLALGALDGEHVADQGRPRDFPRAGYGRRESGDGSVFPRRGALGGGPVPGRRRLNPGAAKGPGGGARAGPRSRGGCPGRVPLRSRGVPREPTVPMRPRRQNSVQVFHHAGPRREEVRRLGAPVGGGQVTADARCDAKDALARRVTDRGAPGAEPKSRGHRRRLPVVTRVRCSKTFAALPGAAHDGRAAGPVGHDAVVGGSHPAPRAASPRRRRQASHHAEDPGAETRRGAGRGTPDAPSGGDWICRAFRRVDTRTRPRHPEDGIPPNRAARGGAATAPRAGNGYARGGDGDAGERAVVSAPRPAPVLPAALRPAVRGVPTGSRDGVGKRLPKGWVPRARRF